MIAASAVIVSHSFPLSLGIGAKEPLMGLLPTSLGGLAVIVFFAVSGFLIMQSWVRRKSLTTFLVARWARIAPGLLAVLLLMALLLPPLSANPYPNLENGSLWTLWYEVVCYSVLAVFGLVGGFRAFLVVYSVFYVAVAARYLPINPAYALLTLPFVLGASFIRLQFVSWVAVGLFIFPLTAMALGWRTYELWMLAFSYGALWFGFARIPYIGAYNRLGDYSYGTYIYGWPVQQVLAATLVGIGPFAMMSLALPIAWLIGAASWHFLESPALVWAKETAGKLVSRPPRAAALSKAG